MIENFLMIILCHYSFVDDDRRRGETTENKSSSDKNKKLLFFLSIFIFIFFKAFYGEIRNFVETLSLVDITFTSLCIIVWIYLKKYDER